MENKLIQAMREAVAYAKGDLTMGKASQHEVFTPLKIPQKVDLKELRKTLNMTQEEFAVRYGFNLFTLRNWEHGRRHPDQAVLAYLYAISKNPNLIEETLRS